VNCSESPNVERRLAPRRRAIWSSLDFSNAAAATAKLVDQYIRGNPDFIWVKELERIKADLVEVCMKGFRNWGNSVASCWSGVRK